MENKKTIYHFKGVAGASHTVYTPNQVKARKVAKSKTKYFVYLTDNEIMEMRKIAGIRRASTEHTLRAFITKILNQ